MSACLFCKISAGEIPAKVLFEDENMMAFHDIQPAAAVHFLIIPKKHIESLAHAQSEDAELLGAMLLKGAELAREQGLLAGFKTQINTGRGGGQEVFHLHIHIMGTPASAAEF